MARRVMLPFAPGDRRPWVLVARQVARDIESGELAPGDRVTMPSIRHRVYLDTGKSVLYTSMFRCPWLIVTQ